jgi:hypothetical protein
MVKNSNLDALGPKLPPLKKYKRKPRPRHEGRFGKKRDPIPTNPHIDERQTRAYDLRVQGASIGVIATQLGVSHGTAALDIKLEGQRRAAERESDRRLAIENSLSGYESVALAARFAINQIAQELAAAQSWKERVALRSLLPKERQVILKAMRQAEEVQGLHDAKLAIHVDNSTTNQNTVFIEAQEILGSLTGDMRAVLRERRRVEALKNVTPA